jgi:hypothetical protein
MAGRTIILLFVLATCVFPQDTVRIIIDEPVSTNLPRNFRKCNGGFQRLYDGPVIDTTGLNGLNISGSAEFGAINFPALLKATGQSHIMVIDLRQETHFLVNGITISWYGRYDWADVGLTRTEVLALEKKRIDSVKNLKSLNVMRVIKKEKATDTFLEFKDTILNIESVISEEEFLNQDAQGYFRITATDHRQPNPEDVDRFVEFVNGTARPKWLHFHCHAGDGRTTTFMVMYDMIKNAKDVGMDDIIERQYLIGGIDLSNTEDFPSWDKKYAVERAAFLLGFYKYCRGNSDGFKTKYSEWIKKQ